MKIKFKQNFNTVELCLTYKCSIKCNNCSNLCSQAPATMDLNIDDVVYFLNDITNNKNLKKITIHGGEPVLNPDIEEILRLLYNFRRDNNITLWLLTNYSNDQIKKRTEYLSEKFSIELGISEKDGNNLDYIPVNESPTDLNEQYTIGCFQIEDCGICFNKEGYFPCSPMAAAARVFNYKPITKKFNELTEERCIEYLNKHCKHCGFALPDRRRVKEQTSTKTWIKKLDMYNRKVDK